MLFSSLYVGMSVGHVWIPMSFIFPIFAIHRSYLMWPFFVLQSRHAVTKFFKENTPPRFFGTMWSTVKEVFFLRRCPLFHCAYSKAISRPQYQQIKLSLCHTNFLSVGMWFSFIFFGLLFFIVSATHVLFWGHTVLDMMSSEVLAHTSRIDGTTGIQPWACLYQVRLLSPSGGVLSLSWFQCPVTYRPEEPPERPTTFDLRNAPA